MQNEMKKPKVIAMILEEIGSEFSRELIQNAVNAIPAGENVRLVALVGKYIDRVNDSESFRVYKTVYNSVFRLDELCQVDGMIIHLGSMSKRRKKVIKTGYSERFQSIPKVFIASDIEGETVINYDNESGIREAVDCLVNVEGLTKFCMLGGRDDNFDARSRKQIFIRSLSENNISFSDKNYQKTDMSNDSEAEAEQLLKENPDVQAIFCVNDAVAKGLYAAMKKRELIPGKDIFVFGFDNTHMAGEISPTLSSIGADHYTLSQKAVEVLLNKLDGKETVSAYIPTRLYGRESFHYEMYDYTTLEMLQMDTSFIYRMFDDCLYRYRTAYFDRESVNLRRLFYEYISRMLLCMKQRYMSTEEFDSLCELIDIFFEKGAMEYTDATKLLQSIGRLQRSMNTILKTSASSIMINRLFARMKDRIISVLSEQQIKESNIALEYQKNLQDFKIICSAKKHSSGRNADRIFRNINKLGIQNAAVYLFNFPLKYDLSKRINFPEHIYLQCVVRSGEVYLLPKERRQISLREMFTRNELPVKCRGYAAFPLFYSDLIYGFLLCELTDDIYKRGEYIAMELGEAIYLGEKQQ